MTNQPDKNQYSFLPVSFLPQITEATLLCKQYFVITNRVFMENKAVDKPRTSRPSLFDPGWMEKFFNAPIDEFFNLGKVANVPAVNVNETDKEFRLSIAAPGL